MVDLTYDELGCRHCGSPERTEKCIADDGSCVDLEFVPYLSSNHSNVKPREMKVTWEIPNNDLEERMTELGLDYSRPEDKLFYLTWLPEIENAEVVKR